MAIVRVRGVILYIQWYNPFEKKVFSFLAGSAQLEGSTMTEGDTAELLLNDIYPDKPQKDIQMVKNLNEALKYILNNKEADITPERIKEINVVYAKDYKVLNDLLIITRNFRKI